MNWPRLSPDKIRDQYDGNYYIFREAQARRWSRSTQLYLDYLHALEGRTCGRRLLDVGCATGELLAIARRRGWEVAGVEVSAAAAETARSRYRLPVHTGTLEAQNGELGTFDVVVATDVLEHVVSPKAFVRAIHDRLRPGAQVVIETPNWGGWWRRVGGRRWLGYNRFHIFLFDKHALGYLMRACGFQTCALLATTHVAHRQWGNRPELAGLLACLPAGLQWRCQRWLNRLTPLTRATQVPGEPLTSLDQALKCISQHMADLPDKRSVLVGDNLAVIAHR